MDKEPINNDKDVPKEETHKVYGFGSHHIRPIKLESNIKEPIPYEPKRNNRWTIKFKEPFKSIPAFVIRKTSRPKLLNGSWANIEIHLGDIIGSYSTTMALMEGFRHCWQKYNIKIPVIDYSLEMLDPTGVTIEKWTIKGEIIEADFGDLNYANKKLSKVKLIIKPIKINLEY